jgi:hypothetical protein
MNMQCRVLPPQLILLKFCDGRHRTLVDKTGTKITKTKIKETARETGKLKILPLNGAFLIDFKNFHARQ